MTSNEPRLHDNELLLEPKFVIKAAVEARRKLSDQLQLESCMIFYFPAGDRGAP